MTHGPGPLARGLFRLAAQLHPEGDRRSYGSDMEAAFAEGWRAHRRRGWVAATRYTFKASADAALSGLRMRRWTGRRRGGGVMGMAEWIMDVRVAARSLRKTPGFTLAAALVLALGVGANAAIFSAVKATLLAPPPFPDPDRIVLLDLTDSSTVRPGPPRAFPWSLPKFRVLQETEGRLADPVAAFATRNLILTGTGDATQLAAELVTPDYLDILGVAPVLGRDFQAGDDTEEAPPTALLSHGLWQERFGGDPAVLGSSLTLNGRPVTVVGVAPAGFRGLSGQARVWVPVHTGSALIAPFLVRNAQAHWLRAVGRLDGSASLEALRTQMRAVGLAAEEAYPDTDPTVARGGDAERLADARTNPQARRSLLILGAAAGLLLLVACANLAGLLVARASGRERETAVRAALGAGRWRVARGFLAESTLLALLGGAAAVVVARFGAGWLAAVWPARFRQGSWNLQFADPAAVQVDGGVLVFAAAVALVAGLALGLVPTLHALRTPPGAGLREGTGGSLGRRRASLDLRGGLVAVEIALALVLVVGAGLLLRSLASLQAVDGGYETGHLVTFDVGLPRSSTWAEDPAAFHEDFLARVSAVPGVVSASLGCVPPLSGHCMITRVREAGARQWSEGSMPSIGVHYVSDGYFRTLGVEVLRGRTFTPEDQPGSPPVVVLSETAARELFPDGDALGQRLAAGIGLTSDEGTYAEVVGIVADVLYDRPENGVMAELYASHRQDPGTSTYLVRTSGEPLGVLPAIRARLADVDADLPLSSVRTMEEIEALASADTRILSTLLSAFAALALLLACTGVWAVVAYGVARRTRELGLRMALGAEPGEVVGLVLRRGLVTAVVGVVVGAAAAWASSEVLQSLLFEVGARDPVSFVGGAGLLLVVATLAAWLPARRATRVDPMDALREG